MFNLLFRPDVPGFRVRPPGFNVDVNGLSDPRSTWSIAGPPSVGDADQPRGPQLPEWLQKLLTMPDVFDPWSGRRPLISPVTSRQPTDQNEGEIEDEAANVGEIDSQLDRGPIDTTADDAIVQNRSPGPMTDGMTWNIWPQAVRGTEANAQATGTPVHSPWDTRMMRRLSLAAPPVVPLTNGNFIRATISGAGDASDRSTGGRELETLNRCDHESS